MFVYGVRCAPLDLQHLPEASADYYMDYGLLVFPEHTRATCVKNHGRLTPQFWASVKRIVENPMKPHQVDLEDPYLEEPEAAVVEALRDAYPSTSAAWYYVPRAVIQEIPSIQVSDLS